MHLLLLSCLAGCSLLTTGNDQTPPADLAFPPHLACGPHCLYQFLKLHRADISYGELASHLDVTASGVSMMQLRNAAAHFEVHLAVRKFPSIEVARTRLPLIAHFRRRQRQRDDQEGHFVIILEATEDGGASVLDGSTGHLSRLSPRGLDKLWTGYALVSTDITAARLDRWVDGMLLVCAAFSSMLIVNGLLRSARTRYPFTPTILISSCLLSASAHAGESMAVTARDQPATHMHLRHRGNSGTNSLYLLLASRGHALNYRTLSREVHAGGSESLLAMRNAAASRRFPMSVWKCTLVDLTAERLPAIAYVDGRYGEGPSFVLLLAITGNQVALIDGGSNSYHQVPVEPFLRRWTGYVLVPSIRSDRRPIAWTIALSGAAILLHRVIRRRGPLRARVDTLPS